MHGHMNVKSIYWDMTCNDVMNNRALVSALTYVMLEIRGKVSTNICVPDIGYNTAPLHLCWHAIMWFYIG